MCSEWYNNIYDVTCSRKKSTLFYSNIFKTLSFTETDVYRSSGSALGFIGLLIFLYRPKYSTNIDTSPLLLHNSLDCTQIRLWSLYLFLLVFGKLIRWPQRISYTPGLIGSVYRCRTVADTVGYVYISLAVGFHRHFKISIASEDTPRRWVLFTV